MSSQLLCSLGHMATTRSLYARGVSQYQIRVAVQTGRVIRIVRGTYGCDHLDPDTLAAARVGGAITCISALRRASVWAGHSQRLHVQVNPSASIMGNVVDELPDLHLHWQEPRFGMIDSWTPTNSQTLWAAIHCLDEENAIAAMESALHEGFLSPAEIHRIATMAPRSLHDGIRRMVSNSGSGTETIVRLRLERAGYRVESQGHVPGMGHEDLVIEDCVGLDVDGRKWHGEDRFAIDRERDLRVEGLGRRALRITAADITKSWPETLAVIDRAVSDALRERRRKTGRIIVRFDDPL